MGRRGGAFPTAVALLLAAATGAFAAGSLSGSTGLWDMPTARVLPDWSIRAGYSRSGPWTSYSAAVGLFDRLELHGRILEVEGVDAFPGEGFGDFKDRSSGARLVLLPEGDLLPQVAVGADDVTGTGLFSSRYVVVSKLIGEVDFTLGLGQGVLAGDLRIPGVSSARDVLISSPFRETSLFGGLEWRATDRLTLAAEYSSLEYETLLGYEHDPALQVNVGLRYALLDYLRVYAAVMRGRDLAVGVEFAPPLQPEGILPWERRPGFRATEKQRWEMAGASNEAIARALAVRLQEDGFGVPSVSVGQNSAWLQAANTVSLSGARALGRMGRLAHELAPARITTFYLNLAEHGRVVQTLRTNRRHLLDYLESRIDRETFLAFADVALYGGNHWEEHARGRFTSPLIPGKRQRRYSFSLEPKLRTFLSNRRGYLKHKVVLRGSAGYRPWEGGLVSAEMEAVLYNDYDDVAFAPLEDDAVRTDGVAYEQGGGLRLSRLFFDQRVAMPWGFSGRVGWGLLETGYAGVAGECFRYFLDGRVGAGLEMASVLKRDPDHNLKLGGLTDKRFVQALGTFYWQPWAETLTGMGLEGVEAGVRAGRFLAGDWGVRLDLRRTFRHFTIGVWFTATDTSGFSDERNRGHTEKGAYIRVPLSLFTDRDVPGHLSYGVSSFTRDTGQRVRQPRSLFPLDNESTPVQTRLHLDEMRR